MDNQWALKCSYVSILWSNTHPLCMSSLSRLFLHRHLLYVAPSATATCQPIYTTTPTETLSVGKTSPPHVLLQRDWQVWQEYCCPTTHTHCQVDSGERECGSHRQQPTSLRHSLATHHFSNQHVCGRTVGSWAIMGCVHVHCFSFVMPY